MDDPLEIGPRYHRAARHGMRFAAAFTVACATLTALSSTGVTGQRQDARLLLGLTLIGVVLFIFMRLLIRTLRI